MSNAQPAWRVPFSRAPEMSTRLGRHPAFERCRNRCPPRRTGIPGRLCHFCQGNARRLLALARSSGHGFTNRTTAGRWDGVRQLNHLWGPCLGTTRHSCWTLQQTLRVKAGEKTQAGVKSRSGEGALLGSGREFVQAVEIKGDICFERCPSLERQMLHRRLLGRLAMERLSIF